MNSEKTFSIRTRLLLLGVAVFVLALALALNSSRSTYQLGAAQRQSSEAVSATRYLANAQNVMWQLRFGISQYLAVPKPEEHKRLSTAAPSNSKRWMRPSGLMGSYPLPRSKIRTRRVHCDLQGYKMPGRTGSS